MAVRAKINNRMLLERLRLYIDLKLRNTQNGCRKGRSTIARILTFRRLVEGIKSKNLPALITFVGFRKTLIQSTGGKVVKY